MDWKTTYTKIFLQQANISITETTIKEYLPVWWRNSRVKDEGGLRLTEEGLKFVQDRLQLHTYDVPFPQEFTITTQVLIFLDIDGVMLSAAGWKPVENLPDGFSAFSKKAANCNSK